MPRVRKGAARTRKHKRILKATRGQIGAASRRYRAAKEAVFSAGQYASIGRKLKKRDYRRLWITRISAACRQRGLTYSRFMNALATHGIEINRKSLADIAVSDPAAFDRIVAVAAGKVIEKPVAAPSVEKPAVEQVPPEKAETKPAAEKKTEKKTAVKKKTATAKKTVAKKTTVAKKPVAKKTTKKKTAEAKKSK